MPVLYGLNLAQQLTCLCLVLCKTFQHCLNIAALVDTILWPILHAHRCYLSQIVSHQYVFSVNA